MNLSGGPWLLCHVGPALAQAIRRTAFCCDPDSKNYTLGGIALDFSTAAVCSLVATDTRRLAVAQVPNSSQGTPFVPRNLVLIPLKTASLLERMLPDAGTSEVRIVLEDDTAAHIRTPAGDLYTRMIAGRFPKYQTVIPQAHPIQVVIPCGAAAGAFRQAQICTTVDYCGVLLEFEPGRLRLSSQAAQVGRALVQLPIAYDGPSVRLPVNPHPVGEFLRTFPAETPATWHINTADDPVLLEVGQQQFFYTVMPLAFEQPVRLAG